MSDDSASERKWFYIDQAGETQGPMTLAEVVQRNEGLPDYYLFTEGLPDWVKASDLPAASAALGQVPQPKGTTQPQSTEPPPTGSQLATEKQRRWLMALGAEPQRNLLKTEASTWIAQLEGGGIEPTEHALAEYKEWKRQTEGTDRRAWKKDQATEKQRILLTLYGIEAGSEMTKGEASEIISRNERQQQLPTEENSLRYSRLTADRVERDLAENLERKKQLICSYIDKLKVNGLGSTEMSEIQFSLKYHTK
jgi:hypothetical protein